MYTCSYQLNDRVHSPLSNKDNCNKLPDLPDEYDNDTKIKKLKVASFPLVLPVIKVHEFKEGSLEDEDVCKSMADLHDLYAEFFF